MRLQARIAMMVVIVTLLIIGPASVQITAQGPATCPTVVTQALSQLADSCGGLGRNSACYGNTRVDSTFYQPVDEASFSQPADVASLVDLSSLATAPLDLETLEWGIAVMNAQANVPGTIPGQAVTFLLMGDASVENRVMPDEATLAVDPVELTTSGGAGVRRQPLTDAVVVDFLDPGVSIMADAQDDTGAWVRVLFRDEPAWMIKTDFANGEAASGLPVITNDSLSPMQAFYFTTGIGAIQCREAPNAVTIEGNESVVVDLNVNGADIRIGSTINFRTITEDQVAVTVLDGYMEIVDSNTIVTGGQTAVGLMDEEGSIIGWLEIRSATEEELEIAQVGQTVLAIAQGEQPPPAPSEVIHLVVSGETLFSIARRYDTSMQAIIDRNNLDPGGQVDAGQELVIPDPGSGFVSLTQSSQPPQQPQQPSQPQRAEVRVDCGNFKPTSPTDGMVYGANTFYWDAAVGATSYRLTVVNLSTGQIANFNTSGPQTNLVAVMDQETIGGGFEFYWYVTAMVDGQVACASTTAVTERGTTPAVVAPPFSAGWGCNGLDMVISFSNAQAGETITMEFSFAGRVITRTAVGPSGSTTFSVGAVGASGGKVSGPQSGTITLSPSQITC